MRQKRQAEAGQHVTYTQRQIRWREARACIATLAAVGAWTWAIAGAIPPEAPPIKPHVDPQIERILRAACTLPDVNGAITVFAKLDGKMTCWRMR